MDSGLNVASMPPAIRSAPGRSRRARWASARSKRRVMPVVEKPTTSQGSAARILARAASGGPSQQLGSKTLGREAARLEHSGEPPYTEGRREEGELAPRRITGPHQQDAWTPGAHGSIGCGARQRLMSASLEVAGR